MGLRLGFEQVGGGFLDSFVKLSTRAPVHARHVHPVHDRYARPRALRAVAAQAVAGPQLAQLSAVGVELGAICASCAAAAAACASWNSRIRLFSRRLGVSIFDSSFAPVSGSVS